MTILSDKSNKVPFTYKTEYSALFKLLYIYCAEFKSLLITHTVILRDPRSHENEQKRHRFSSKLLSYHFASTRSPFPRPRNVDGEFCRDNLGLTK